MSREVSEILSDESGDEFGSQGSPITNYDDGYDAGEFYGRIIDDDEEDHSDKDANKENEQIEQKAQEKMSSLSIKQGSYEKGYSEAEKVLNANILILCSSLGGLNIETNKYDLGIDALACLKDLKRWIKRVDNETNTWHVASALDDNKLVINDLIPILTQLKPSQESSDNYDTSILLAVLELLVSLTSPLMLDIEKATDTQLGLYIKLKKAQVVYKNKILSFENGKSLKAIVGLSLPILAMGKKDRTTRDTIILNLCLNFFRNVIRIEPPELTVSRKNTSSSRIQQANDNMPTGITKDDISFNSVVLAFKKNKVFKFIQIVTAGLGSEFSQEILANVCFECYFYLTYGLDHNELSNEADSGKAIGENNTEAQTIVRTELAEIYNKDKELHNQVLKKKQMSRHANFGTMMSLRQNDGTSMTMSGQSKLSNSDIIEELDSKKTQIKADRYSTGKNESTRSDFDTNLSSLKSKRLSVSGKQIMKGFCVDFVEAGFNTIISIMRKQIIDHQSAFLEFHYFSVVSWFLKFERLQREANVDDIQLQLRYGYIQESLAEDNLRLVLKNNMPRYLDQREYNLLRVAVENFKEILMVGISMHQLTNPADGDFDTKFEIESYIDASEGILRNIFSNEIDVDILFRVAQDANKVSFRHMDEMIEYVHVFFKALKYLSQLKNSLAMGRKRVKVNTVKIDKNIEFGDSEDEDMAEAISNAHTFIKFDKDRYKIFERRLMHEKIVNTYVAFFSKFDELSETQIRRCLSYFNRILLNDEHFLKLTRLDFMLTLHDLKNARVSQGLMKELHKVLSYFMTKLERLFRKTHSMGVELITTNQNPDVSIRQYLLTGEVNVSDVSDSKNRKKITKYRFTDPEPDTQIDKIAILTSSLVYKDDLDLLNELRVEIDRVVEKRLFLLGDNAHQLEPVKFPDSPVYFKSSKSFYQNGLFVFLLEIIGFKVDELSVKSYYIPSDLDIDFLKEVSETLEYRSRNPIDNDTVATALEVIAQRVADIDADDDFGGDNFQDEEYGNQRSNFDDFAADYDDQEESEGFNNNRDNAAEPDQNEDTLAESGILDDLDHLESHMRSVRKGIAVRKGTAAKALKKKRSRRNRVMDSDDDDLNELLPAKKQKKGDKEKTKKKKSRSKLPAFEGSDSEKSKTTKQPEKQKAHLSSKYVVDSDDDSDDEHDEFFLRESRLQQLMRTNDGKPLSADQFSSIFSTVKKKAEAAAASTSSAISSMPFLGLDEPLTSFRPHTSTIGRGESDEDSDDDDDALSDESRADSDIEDDNSMLPTHTQRETNDMSSQHHHISLADIMKDDASFVNPLLDSDDDEAQAQAATNHKRVTRILEESDEE